MEALNEVSSVVASPGPYSRLPERSRAVRIPSGRADLLVLSARYGAGHWQAGRAICEAVRSFYPGLPIAELDYMDLVHPAVNRTLQTMYLTSIKHFPSGYGWFYRTTCGISPDSGFQSFLNSLGRENLTALLEEARPRVVISTFPTQAGVLSDLRRRGRLRIPTITVITDNTVHSQWVHPFTDVYCVSSPEVATRLAERGVDPGRILATGIPVRQAFANPPDPHQARARLQLDPELPIVLVMSGAFGALGGTVAACRVLTHMGRPLQLVVIAGRDRQLVAQLRRMTEDFPYPVHIMGFVEEVSDFMAAADVLVTKAGGVTTAEAVAVGLPMVIFRPIPGQEEANASYFCTHGAAVQAHNTTDLLKAVDGLLGDRQWLQTMRAAARALGRPGAARTVTEVALRLGGLIPRSGLSLTTNDIQRVTAGVVL